MPGDLIPFLPGPDEPVPPAGLYRAGSPLRRLPGAALRLVVRNRHVSIPLGVPSGMLAAGGFLASRHAAFDTGVVAAAASATVWLTADRKWSRAPRVRGWRWTSEVAYARATVVGGTGWLFLAAAYGPLHAGLEITLAAECLAWGIPFWLHKRPRDKRARRRHARTVERWDWWWQSHAVAWGAGGSRVLDAEERGALESLLIQLVPGRQSIGDLKGIVPLLESALGGYVRHGMTRLEIDKANPSQVWLHLKRDDPLREVIEWDDSMCPDDITKPAPLGLRESGKWLWKCLRASFFIIGRTRRGKSNELSVMLATITRCRNARALLIDMKGGRAARPWLPALDWLATTTDEADLLLRFLLAEIKARGTYAYAGQEQLHPTEEVPTLLLVIDETYEVTSEMSGSPGAARRAGWLATIASQGQGVEIYVIDTSQYGALEETVGTEQTRSNLNTRMCFQTEERKHGTFALGDDAYNKVDTTKLAEKGQFYYRADSKTSPEQIRGPLLDHASARQIAERNAERTGLHDRPLRLYASDWQQVYDTRWHRLPPAFLADAPQAAHIAPSPGTVAGAESSKINMGVAVQPADEIDAQVAAINAEVDESPVTDADVARAAAQREARGEGPVDLASEFDHRKRRFAILLQGASPESPVSPAQLRKAAGLSESWVHLMLAKLTEAGAVDKHGRARYAPVSGADILAAIEAVRREGDRLGEQAKDLVGAAER